MSIKIWRQDNKRTIKSGSDISMFYPYTTNYINSFRFIISYKVLRNNCMDGRTSECKGQKVDVPIAERTSLRRTRSGNAQKLEKPSFINDKVLRQTEEANLIVASSYNAVVKWSLNNSLNPMKMQNSASVYKTNREFS